MHEEGKVLSFVSTDRGEIQLICFSKADNSITVIRNFDNYKWSNVTTEIPSESDCLKIDHYFEVTIGRVLE